MALYCRQYGASGPLVILLHGGPGAPGYMAPVARELAGGFRVLEPFQRRVDQGARTVADHVADLRELIASRGECPALVGSSWGAMLGLAFAAAHPDLSGQIVLIGCGTFDTAARARLQATVGERMSPELRERFQRLSQEIPDSDERLRVMGDVILPVYAFDPINTEQEMGKCDSQAADTIWADMVRLQEQGIYLSAFARITSPVLMLHGAYDPHPGRMILEGLRPHLPQIEYREWERCGHYPWLEREVKREFFTVLKRWLATSTSRPASS